MKKIDTTVDFLTSTGISNILNRSNDINGEDLAYLENMTEYMKNNNSQSDCLLRNLKIIKNNISII